MTKVIIVEKCINCPYGEEYQCNYNMVDWETYPDDIPEWCELKDVESMLKL